MILVDLFFCQLLPPTFTIAASWLLLFASAIDVTAHCDSTILMPPSMLLLAVAMHVDCYFAAALVCNCENGSKPPTTVTPTVVLPTPRPTVPIPPTTRPTIPPPLTPCFERGIVGRVLLRWLSTVTKVTAVSTCSSWWIFLTKYFTCCCGAVTTRCTGANASLSRLIILLVDCCFLTQNCHW